MKFDKKGIIKQIYIPKKGKKQEIPLFKAAIEAGFPSPASDYIENTLDLNEFLLKNPTATFFLRVNGNSMINAGIHNDDILIVDRSINPESNKIVIASLDEELTVKRIRIVNNSYFLVPENDEFDEIEITNEMDFIIWGVVTYVIHKV